MTAPSGPRQASGVLDARLDAVVQELAALADRRAQWLIDGVADDDAVTATAAAGRYAGLLAELERLVSVLDIDCAH